MEHTYQYLSIVPFITLPVPILIGAGLLLFPTGTKKLHRIWAFRSLLLLSIVIIFSTNLSIQQINRSSIYQYVWSWAINNIFPLEFGYRGNGVIPYDFVSHPLDDSIVNDAWSDEKFEVFKSE